MTRFLAALSLLFAFATSLAAGAPDTDRMMTADEMRAASRAGQEYRALVKQVEDMGITVLDGTPRDDLLDFLAPTRISASTLEQISCKTIFTAQSDGSSALVATYIITPDGAFQVHPRNEAIVQEGRDVVFTGVTSPYFRRVTTGAFRLTDVVLSDILDLYFTCSG